MSNKGDDNRTRAGFLASTNSDSDGVRGGGEGEVNGVQSSAVEGGAASPPLIILSSRFKHANSLSKISNPGVVVVYYKYESTSLEGLLAQVGKSLQGGRALSIALLMHGHKGYFKINKEKSVSAVKLREDKEVRQFFSTLVESHLDRGSPLSRVDLLQSSLHHGSEGTRTLQELRTLLKVSVHASPDILGVEVSVPGSRSSVRIGTLYFDGEKLKDWVIHSGKESLALYEKMWIEGVGAYGRAIVYRRRDDNSFVILKEINMMELSKEQRVLALNEVEVLSRLDHPNIISFYDSFEEDGTLVIEMEYAEKGTLAKYLSSMEHTLGEKEILAMFAQMAAAIEYLHDHKILHRDLKTANIFLTKEGMVKLGDFGISKILSHTNQQAQTVLGTPYYISPEICESRPYDTKSDIWALGCILYEMACGRRTFEGTNLGALVNKIMSGTFEPVTGNYRPEFLQLITDMLQVVPDRRPSAMELVMVRLPPLMEQLIREEEEPETNTEDDKTEDSEASQRTRSFAYHLDHESNQLRPVDLPIRVKLEQVAVGFSHFIALSEDCNVFSWGENTHGQLGLGDVISRGIPQPIESLKGSKICKVECGGEFSVFVSDKGIILTCGRGHRGALGHTDSWEDVPTPKLITSLFCESVVDVACGEAHVVAMTADNGLLSWGAGGCGRLGNGSEEDQNSPRRIPMSETVAAVKCGMDGSLFLTTSGRLFACGSNQNNKLGLNERVTFRMQLKKLVSNVETTVLCKTVPTPIRELREYRVVDMAMGPTHTAVLVSSGRVFAFGRNMEGQLGTGLATVSSLVTKSQALQEKAMAVVCGEVSTVAVSENCNDINNCFLLWGSPPITSTPLTALLKQASVKGVASGNHGNNSDAPKSSEVESGVPQRGRPLVGSRDPPPLLSPILPNDLSLPDSYKSELSNDDGHLASTEPSPERKLSGKSMFPLLQDSSNYLLSLLELLPDPPPSNPSDKKPPSRCKNKKNTQTAAPDVVANGDISYTTKVVKFATADGTVVDFNALGWRRIKLSQLASFGPNLVVLIEAVVPESPEHSSVGQLRGASFRVKPELRRFTRWTSDFCFDPLGLRCSRPQTPLSRGPTPQPSRPANEKKNIIVSMVDYTAGSSTDESKIPTWLADDLEDARHNAAASPLSPGQLPLGLPVIVGQGPRSNNPLAAILMHQPQQRPQTVDQPSPRSPCHRSISNETVTVPPKPRHHHPQDHSPLPQTGPSTHGVRRYQSDNALAPKRDVAAGLQLELVQRRDVKGTLRSSSPNRPPVVSPYWGGGGGASGPHQGAVRGETPAAGQLKLPSIVNSSQQTDPVLLGNQRSKSGSQIMSPTFIRKLNPVGNQSKPVGMHGLFPRRQSIPVSVEGRLRRHVTSDSATTDDDVAMATPSQAWKQASHSSATTSSEEDEEEEEVPVVGVESGLGSGHEPLPSSSSDEVFDHRSYHGRQGGVAKSKAAVVRRPESGRNQSPGSAKAASSNKRSPYLSRLSKQSHSRGGSAKPHNRGTPTKSGGREDRTANREQMKNIDMNQMMVELDIVRQRQQGYEEKLLQAQHSSEQDKAALRAEVERLQLERDRATALLEEERERQRREQARDKATQSQAQVDELQEQVKALKEMMSKYECMNDKRTSQESQEHGRERTSSNGVVHSQTGVATAVEGNSLPPPPEEGGIPKVTVLAPSPKKKKRPSGSALLGWGRKSTSSVRADSANAQETTQSQFCSVM